MGYRVLRFKLRCLRSFKRGAASNQDVGSNNASQRWKISSRTSVARWRGEIAKQLLLCNGATQVARTAPAERRNAEEALPRKHWHGCQCWIRSESWSSWTEWKQRVTAMVFTTSSRHKPEEVRSVCNVAAKYEGVAVNDKRLSGPDLL